MTSRLKEVIRIIKEEGRGLEQYRNVSYIAWEIFIARGNRKNVSEEFKFTPTPKELSFQEFIYDWGKWFSSRKIPFEEWSDICDEGMALTLEFIESDLEDYKDLEEYESFNKKRFHRKEVELYESDKYTEEQKRAWWDMGY